MIKITGAKIDNKIVEVMEVIPYDSERGLVEIFFMFNGVTRVGAVISEADLITEEVSVIDAKTEELVSLIEEELDAEVSVDAFDEGNWIYITGDTYTVNVFVDEAEFCLETLHMELSKNYGIYEDTYKNKVARKTTKGAFNYIKKFI